MINLMNGTVSYISTGLWGGGGGGGLHLKQHSLDKIAKEDAPLYVSYRHFNIILIVSHSKMK